MVYTVLFFSLQNAVCFIILTYLVPVLFTFYTQGVLKLKKKNNSGAKRLIHVVRMFRNIQKEELVSRILFNIRRSGLHYYKGKLNFFF